MTLSKDAQFWDRIARKYAEDPVSDIAGYERTLERTRELLRPEARAIELGCGTGSTALRLAPSVADYLATDFSEEMIEIAREKLDGANIPNLRFRQAMAQELADGPADAFADVVLAFNVLHLVPELGETLSAIARLLPPGGLFISKTPCLKEMNPAIRLAIPIARLAGKAPRVAVFSAETLEQALEEAGFELMASERHGSGAKDPRVFLVARR